MCCTGSRHNRPTLTHAELMRERKKRGLGSYRKDSDEESPRCTQCGHDKPIDRWKTCPACREKVQRNRPGKPSLLHPRKAGRPKDPNARSIRGPCLICGRRVYRKRRADGTMPPCVHVRCEEAPIPLTPPEPKCSRCLDRPREVGAYCQRCKDYIDARDARERVRIARQLGEAA